MLNYNYTSTTITQIAIYVTLNFKKTFSHKKRRQQKGAKTLQADNTAYHP
jgi:hypothetical protein